jgi:hypothetical protein
MKPVALAIVFLGLASPAGAQATKQTDQLLGAWKCESSDKATTAQALVTYLASGKETIDLTMAVGAPLNLQFSATAAGDWTLTDGVLVENITSFRYIRGMKDGRPTAPGFLETLLGKTLFTEPMTSTVEVKDDVLILKKSDGAIGSRCKRN